MITLVFYRAAWLVGIWRGKREFLHLGSGWSRSRLMQEKEMDNMVEVERKADLLLHGCGWSRRGRNLSLGPIFLK